jgi:hypothetical protein
VFGSFSAGDSLRVYRLQRKGLSLDMQHSLTQPTTPLREAWLAFLTQQAMGQPTYVLYDLHDGEGFIQVRYRPHQAAADVAFLAPALQESHLAANAWSHLLDGACVEAAGRGIQHVFANVPDSAAEVDIFQQAGFILYTGEEIYRLAHLPAVQEAEEPLAMRAQRPEDWPAIRKLCVAITPQRVRQAEGGIAIAAGMERNDQRYVLSAAEDEDLVATLSLHSGGLAHWLRILVHPDVRDMADALIYWALSALVGQTAQPVYCSVRLYEGGLQAALEAAGFEPYARRALMVKHTLAWSKTPVHELATALASSAEAVPPAYRIHGEPELGTPKSRLASIRDT